MRPSNTLFFYTFVINILCASAKINGGPRGRFDNIQRNTNHHHVSAHHAHYSYHPPSDIKFMCRYCHSPASHPVFHGLPPTYVYKYKESRSRFGDLLTGLALFNLGKAVSDNDRQASHYYTPRPNEKCSMQVVDRYHFEETTIPCFMLSSFLQQSKPMRLTDASIHLVDITSSQNDVRAFLHDSGSPIEVNRDQDCVLWHNMTMYKERNSVPCALLKDYAATMKPSGLPVYIWLPILVATVLTISLCCQCFFKRKKMVSEVSPLGHTPVVGYCSS